jgi:hypothetical protein
MNNLQTKTTYNFQLVLIITYMLLTYPQVNLHVNGTNQTFFPENGVFIFEKKV